MAGDPDGKGDCSAHKLVTKQKLQRGLVLVLPDHVLAGRGSASITSIGQPRDVAVVTLGRDEYMGSKRVRDYLVSRRFEAIDVPTGAGKT